MATRICSSRAARIRDTIRIRLLNSEQVRDTILQHLAFRTQMKGARVRKFAVLLAVLFLPAVVWGQSGTNASAEKLSLQQAVALALRRNRMVNYEKLEVERAADRLAVAATRRLPGFDVSMFEYQWFKPPEFRFQRGIFGVFPGLGPVPPVNTTIESSHG